VAGGLTLDAGALIGAEKRVQMVWWFCDRANKRGERVTVPTVVLAQVWRGNSPLIGRLLQGCKVEDLQEPMARRAGELLAKSRTADVIDAVVVLSATTRGDAIVTSDPEDIERLVAAAGSTCRVLRI
jgi:hypothetical protein